MAIINRKKPLPIDANFIDGTGKKGNGAYAVFPICQYEGDSKNLIRFIGTAFFIRENGVFLTAKHVTHDPDGNNFPDLFGVHLTEDKIFFFRKLRNLTSHPEADVAAGNLETMTHKSDKNRILMNKTLKCDYRFQHLGGMVSTFAYPKTKKYPYAEDDLSKLILDTNWEFGNILETYPTGRDSVMLPSSCYRTDMKIASGASGGPVINRHGKVIGINSTGFDGTSDSYVSSIVSALELKFPNMHYKDKKLSSETTLKDLLELK